MDGVGGGRSKALARSSGAPSSPEGGGPPWSARVSA